MTAKAWACWGTTLALWLAAGSTGATEVRFFRQQSTADFIDGEFDGVALDAEGALRPALHFERLAELAEPFIFSARARADGWVLGTGSAGRVLGVTAEGAVASLWAAPEPEIFALWVDPDGTTYVGSSPKGKVYVLGPEGGEEVFDPEESYIWALARAPWGDLLVATGDGARLYGLAPDGSSRLIFESSEAHLRSLHPLADSVLIGTAGEGLILSVDASGQVRTLYDADQAEITAFIDDGEGGWYAAAVEGEASLTKRAAESASESKASGDESQVSVEVEASAGKVTTDDRSAIIHGDGGAVRVVTTLDEETVYSLAWVDGRLWVGTGVEGNVYSLSEQRLTLETSLDDRQVVGLFADARPVLVTTNGAAVHRAAAAPTGAGTYVSKVLDAGAAARFGTLTWRGEATRRGAIEFSVRSGSSSKPDATWSPWSEPAAADALDIAAAPPGRFLQWRVELSPPAGPAARISSVIVSYRQLNTTPTIKAFTALEPGQVLVPSSFNPGDQIYEPAHPDRSGIFTTLEPSAAANGGRLKTLWRHGYLTLKWEAVDANEDELGYSLGFRAEGGSEDFIAMAESVEEDYYSFDATVLPDGVYRFRLEASDRSENSPDEALAATRISEPIVVDHSPPVVLARTSQTTSIRVTIADDLSPIRSAEISVDGSAWEEAVTEDGLLDGQQESLLVDQPPTARLLLLRLTDAAFNVATYNLLEAQ
jgi:hypothetical protein